MEVGSDPDRKQRWEYGVMIFTEAVIIDLVYIIITMIVIIIIFIIITRKPLTKVTITDLQKFSVRIRTTDYV